MFGHFGSLETRSALRPPGSLTHRVLDRAGHRDQSPRISCLGLDDLTRLSIDATEPQGWRLDVTPHLPAKGRAIAAHASQSGRSIIDDPTGFVLPQSLLRALAKPWETFLLP